MGIKVRLVRVCINWGIALGLKTLCIIRVLHAESEVAQRFCNCGLLLEKSNWPK